MLVHNLTDIETPTLTKKKLVGIPLIVGPKVIHPGEFAEVPEDWLRMAMGGLRELVTHGAAAVGPQPPAAYILSKQSTKTLRTKYAPCSTSYNASPG